MQRLPLVIAMSLASASALAQTNVTQDQVVEHYADIAHAVYQDSRITAEELQKKIDALVAAPSEQTLNDAKQAWLHARVFYQQSEVFRFGNL